MRHLGSLLLGLVSVPLLWVLTGFGVVWLNEGIAGGAFGLSVLGFVLLAVAGLLVAALLVPRISPVGPAVVGLCYLALTAWAMLAFGSLIDLLANLGAELELTAPLGGISVVVAVAMLATLVNPHRWRGPRPATPGFAGNRPGYPPVPAPGAAVAPGGPFPAGQFPGGQPGTPGGQFPGGQPAAPGGPFGPGAVPTYPPNVGPITYGPAGYGPVTPPPGAPTSTPYPGRAPETAGSPPTAPLPRAGSTADETTQVTGPADDGTEEATRRLGDR